MNYEILVTQKIASVDRLIKISKGLLRSKYLFNAIKLITPVVAVSDMTTNIMKGHCQKNSRTLAPGFAIHGRACHYNTRKPTIAISVECARGVFVLWT